MNPLIAQIIERMANHDGSLQSAFTTTRSDHNGPEVVTHSSQEQVHPVAGARPQQGGGQHPVILARSGAGPRTGPTDDEAYARSHGGLTQTTGEKGLGMAPINPQAIQQIMQMMMQGQHSGGGPGPVPNVPGPMTPEMVMQSMGGGGGGGGGMDQIMQMLGGGGGGGMPPELMALLGGGGGGAPQGDPEDSQEGPESGPPDAEDRGESTEQELANVHGEMTKANPAQLIDELRQCLDDKDRKGCEQILQELEAAGVTTDKLPPDVQQHLEQDGYLDQGADGDGSDGEGADDGGDHQYR